MNRVEFLDKLEERVLNEPLIQYKYHDYINGKKCFCVIGHAYNILGVDRLLDFMSPEENGKVYSALSSDLLINERCELSIKEFSDLQSLNDAITYKNPSKDDILEYIRALK